MVYLSLSVNDVEASLIYYRDKLGIFTSMGDSRLICKVGPDFIIDLYLVGSDRHKNIFGCSSHQLSHFSISLKEHDDLEILDHLSKQSVEFEDDGNIAGRFIKFIDPSGNIITLVAHHGQIS